MSINSVKKGLRSDIELKGKIWRECIEELVGPVFRTQWDLFKISMAIGILYDQTIGDEAVETDELSEADESVASKQIPRNMFNNNSGDMSYFFKTAILTSNCIEMSDTDRMFMAFSEDVTEDEMEGEDRDALYEGVSEEAINYNRIALLKGFANYGITRIRGCLSNNINEVLENLADFINRSYKHETPELLEMSSVEELIDD